jgi:hypothetical protein
LESINNNASDVKYSWFSGWFGVNFSLSDDVKKQSQRWGRRDGVFGFAELGGDGPTPSDGGDLQKRTQARAIGLG